MWKITLVSCYTTCNCLKSKYESKQSHSVFFNSWTIHCIIFQIFMQVRVLLRVRSCGFGSVSVDSIDVLFLILLLNCFFDFVPFASSKWVSENLYTKLILNPRAPGFSTHDTDVAHETSEWWCGISSTFRCTVLSSSDDFL